MQIMCTLYKINATKTESYFILYGNGNADTVGTMTNHDLQSRYSKLFELFHDFKVLA